ncbi:hypothetical protein [Vibrio sp. 10N.239.312.D08]|uniref:hypothetical protein n=1 Tax=Vibrio sp. 10N.239.312.D08 TaxID=3229978 RepID=UPI00354C5FC8
MQNIKELNLETINLVIQKLTLHKNQEENVKSHLQNVRFFQAFFDSIPDLIKREDLKPVFDALKPGVDLEVSGADYNWYIDSIHADKTPMTITCVFDKFTIELEYELIGKDAAMIVSNPRADITSYGDLTPEQVTAIDQLFSDYAHVLAHEHSIGNKHSLKDTLPFAKALDTESAEDAAMFFNTFGEDSGFYRVIATQRHGERLFKETYIVEADSAEEAKMNTIMYLSPGTNGVYKDGDHYYDRSGDTAYADFNIQHLSRYAYISEGQVQTTIFKEDIEGLELQDISALGLAVKPEDILTLSDKIDIGKLSGSTDMYLNLLKEPGKDEVSIDDLAPFLGVEPYDIESKLVLLDQATDVEYYRFRADHICVPAPLFDYLREIKFITGTELDEVDRTYKFDNGTAIVFDRGQFPGITQRLEAKLGQLNNQTLLITNGGFRA